MTDRPRSAPGATPGALPYDPATLVPDESVGYLMRQAVGSMQARIERAMEPHDLTAMQWQPLYVVARGSATTGAELARHLQVDAGAVTRMLDRLEAKGLIERERSTSDRRVVNLAVTEAGRDAAAVIPHVLCDVLNEHLRGFDADEIAQLRRFLHRMLVNGETSSCGAAIAPRDERDSSTTTTQDTRAAR